MVNFQGNEIVERAATFVPRVHSGNIRAQYSIIHSRRCAQLEGASLPNKTQSLRSVFVVANVKQSIEMFFRSRHSMSLFLLFFLLLFTRRIFGRTNGTILHSLSSDTTLTAAASPYIVNSYLTFGADAEITIENGVTIIFSDAYFITIWGSLNCGCTGDFVANRQSAGLSNNESFVHLVGDQAHPTSIGLYLNHQSPSFNVQFCNTKFDSIQNGVLTMETQKVPYTVTNCEFTHLNYALFHKATSIVNEVYDSYFHDINDINHRGNVIFDRCLMKSYGEFSETVGGAHSVSISNSMLYGDGGAESCINIKSGAVYSNTIIDCQYGIEVWGPVAIRNNAISNSVQYAIRVIDTGNLEDSSAVIIEGNDFGQNANALYDIILDNVSSIEITENTFTPRSGHEAVIYGTDCGQLTVSGNSFRSMADSNILDFRYCTAVHIVDNEFGNNLHGMLAVNHFDHLQVLNNTFTDNAAAGYMISIQNGVDAQFQDNLITNSSVTDYIMMSDEVQTISFDRNLVQNVVFEESAEIATETTTAEEGPLALLSLFEIGNANNVQWRHNQIFNNTIPRYNDSTFLSIHSITDHLEIADNMFSENAPHDICGHDAVDNEYESELLSISSLIDMEDIGNISIRGNEWMDNFNLSAVLLLNNLNEQSIVSIVGNDFIQNGGDNEVVYIHAIHDDSDSEGNDDSIHYGFGVNTQAASSSTSATSAAAARDSMFTVAFNNFHTSDHVKWAISTEFININGNDNYWDGMAVHSDIAHIIEDRCDHSHFGHIHISRINEDPVLIESRPFHHDDVSQCRWNNTDCDIITHYRCHSSSTDTPSTTSSTTTKLDSIELSAAPTPTPTAPTVSPPITPTDSDTNQLFEDDDDDDDEMEGENPMTPQSAHSTTPSTIRINVDSNDAGVTSLSVTEQDDTMLVIAGSIGLSAVFVVLGLILLYIFWKLRKLKLETAQLNSEMKKPNPRRHAGSFPMDSMGPSDFVQADNMLAVPNGNKSPGKSVYAVANHNDLSAHSKKYSMSHTPVPRSRGNSKQRKYSQRPRPRPSPVSGVSQDPTASHLSHYHQHQTPPNFKEHNFADHFTELPPAPQPHLHRHHYSQDDSSELYLSHLGHRHHPIEGMETHGGVGVDYAQIEAGDVAEDPVIQAVLKGLGDGMMTAHANGEASHFSKSGLSIQKFESGTDLSKLQIGALEEDRPPSDDDGDDHRHENLHDRPSEDDLSVCTEYEPSPSEEETSESSHTFTVLSLEEKESNDMTLGRPSPANDHYNAMVQRPTLHHHRDHRDQGGNHKKNRNRRRHHQYDPDGDDNSPQVFYVTDAVNMAVANGTFPAPPMKSKELYSVQNNVSANGYTGLGMVMAKEDSRHGVGNTYALDGHVIDMESPGTPRLQTPRGGMVMSPILDPDAILHSLREKSLKTKHRRKASKSASKSKGKMKGASERRKPSSPHSQKLPKPKTKGQWL